MRRVRGMLMERSDGKYPNGRKRGGQGLVEFTLVLPVLLILLFVFIEGARLLHAWMAIENGARFGIRFAVTGEFDMEACGGTCANEDIARIESIKDASESGASSVLFNLGIDTSDSANWDQAGAFKTTICPSPRDPSQPSNYVPSKANDPIRFAQCIGGDDGGEPGDLVSVTVDFNHPLITPILSNWWPEIHLTSRREAVVESFRTTRTIGMPPAVPTLPATATFTPTETPDHTATPTITVTPTITDPPDCSQVRLYFDDETETTGSVMEANVRNENQTWPLTLTGTYVDWGDSDIMLIRETFDGSQITTFTEPKEPSWAVTGLSHQITYSTTKKFFFNAYFTDTLSNYDTWYYTQLFMRYILPDGSFVQCDKVFRLDWTLPPTVGPSPTASLTPTWGPSLTPTETQEVTPTDTPTITPTREATNTPTPTVEPTITPTVDLGEL